MLFLKAPAPLRGFGKNEIKPLMEKVAPGKCCPTAQDVLIFTGSRLRCARWSVPGGSRELHIAVNQGCYQEKSKMEEANPVPWESSLSLAVRSRPVGAQT